MKQKLAVALIALMALVAPAVADHLFSDVPHDHPQGRSISRAVADGYFTGYEDGTFKPDQPVSDKHIATVFLRAFPERVTRAEMAQVMVAGQEALAGAAPDLADPETDNTAQTNKGRLLNADLPVIRIQNIPWIQVTAGGTEPYTESCHLTHNAGMANRTINNLRNRCRDYAKQWRADWVYIPEGFDTENLFVYYEDGDGNRDKLPFGWKHPRGHLPGVWLSDTETVTPLVVRDVPGRLVDVLIECVKYEAWSESRVSSVEDIPYENCLPEDSR